jgi:glutaredoxin-related protein
VRYIEWSCAARYALTFVIKRELNSFTAATISEEKRSHLLWEKLEITHSFTNLKAFEFQRNFSS